MKTTNKLILAAILIMGTGITASAQFMGGNSSSSRTYGSSMSDQYNAFWVGYAPTTFKAGSTSESGYNTFTVGVTQAKPLSGSPLMFEYGAFGELTHKGEKVNGVKVSMNLAAVKVPVSLMYELPVGDDFSLIPYAGIHGRGYLLGKLKGSYQGQSETVDLFSDDSYDLKRFTLGYQLGIRAGISNYIFGIGYEGGLTEISEGEKINFVMITVGLKF